MLKKTIINIAQLILVVILLPFIAIIFSAFSGNPASGLGTFLMSIISQMPMGEMLFDLLSTLVSGFTAADAINVSITVLVSALPEAIISAIFVSACIAVTDILWRPWKFTDDNKPLPILAAFVGIILSTVFIAVLNIPDSALVTLLSELLLIVILIIGIKFLFKSIFPGTKIFLVKKILYLIIDGLYAIIMTSYVAALTVVATGGCSGIGEAGKYIAGVTGVTVVASVIVWFIHKFDKAADVV